MSTAWVFLGGGLGAVARYGLTLVFVRPTATLAANLLGSLLLALVASSPLVMDHRYRLLVGVGLLGGFTTYSTFNLELLELIAEGTYRSAVGYWALTTASCLAGGGVGIWIASRF